MFKELIASLALIVQVDVFLVSDLLVTVSKAALKLDRLYLVSKFAIASHLEVSTHFGLIFDLEIIGLFLGSFSLKDRVSKNLRL